jgi:hypothetical protein
LEALELHTASASNKKSKIKRTQGLKKIKVGIVDKHKQDEHQVIKKEA